MFFPSLFNGSARLCSPPLSRAFAKIRYSEAGPTIVKHILSTALLLSLAACAPQAELVRTKTEMSDLREDGKTVKARVEELKKHVDQNVQDVQKRLEQLEVNAKGMVDLQKATADYGAKSDQLTADIQLLQGKLEENHYAVAELAQKLDDKSVRIAELSVRLEEFEARVKLLSMGTSTGPGAQAGSAAEQDGSFAHRSSEPSGIYRQAKNDFDKGNFDLALAGFQDYLARYPDTNLASSAQYWIGECFSAKKEYTKAVEAFGAVVKNYPKSEKVPGAKLKIGLTYLNEKNIVKAKEQLNKVIKEHPSSNEAELAKDRLMKISK